MSGMVSPGRLITAVMTWLDQQPGCSPQLRASEVRNAERAAAELLLALDVEPLGYDRPSVGGS